MNRGCIVYTYIEWEHYDNSGKSHEVIRLQQRSEKMNEIYYF